MSAGICGRQAVAGVTIPSVDRVGRYFNFTMASILPEEIAPVIFASNYSEWLVGLESLALSILEEEMDQDRIEAAINELSAELHWKTPTERQFTVGHEHWKVQSSHAGNVRDMLPELTHQLVLDNHERYGVWWHNGSSQVSAQLLTCAEMPASDVYLGLMMDDDQLMMAGADQLGLDEDLLGLDDDPLLMDDDPPRATDQHPGMDDDLPELDDDPLLMDDDQADIDEYDDQSKPSEVKFMDELLSE